MGRQSILSVLAFATLANLSVIATCTAQDYPKRGTVTIVVPYAAGGTTDQQGRLAADILGKALSGTFIVENKLGYGGNIGADFVAKARPDGYTLLLGGIANNAHERRAEAAKSCRAARDDDGQLTAEAV